MGDQEDQIKGIERFQNKLQIVEGIGKKNLKQIHVTMLTFNASQEDMEIIESAFRRVGDCFTDITSEGPFIIGFKGLEVGDGEEPQVIFNWPPKATKVT